LLAHAVAGWLSKATETFFAFFFISSYVGFVPVSDVLAIFVSDRRCKFW
jgi:hypothetical protein